MTSGQDVGTDILGPLFSNANSCFRRDLVLEIPFRSLPSCEDRVWAHDVLRQGYKLAYQARACVHHSHNRGLRDYYYFGKKKGRTRIVLGVEPFCLADCGWFGVKRAWWSLEHWFRKGRAQGRPVVAAARFALAAVSRIIVMNIGVLQGQRGSLQVPAPGGRPSGLAPTGALPEGALPEATPSLPHSASHASC
jgi:hypothetical protein